MLTLAFNTLGNNLSVTLLRNGELMQNFHSDSQSKHSELLIPTIEDLLKKQNISYNELDLIATTIAPGSFTACRVAQVVAKAFKISLKSNILMLDACDVLADKFACQNNDFNGEFIVGFDGSMSEYFVAKYIKKNQQVTKISDSQLLTIKQLTSLLSHNKLPYIGSGKELIINSIKLFTNNNFNNFIFSEIDDKIVALDIAKYAINQEKRGKIENFSDNINYLRQPRIIKRKK